MIDEQTRRKPGRPKGATTGSCGVCASPHRQAIDERLSIGRPFTKIIAEAEQAGVQLSTTLLRRHVDHSPGLITKDTIDESEMTSSQIRANPNKDIAIAIRDRGLELLEAGQMTIEARDALKAQELLDRREEMSKGRVFQLHVLRILSGGGAVAPPAITDGATIVDGEAREVAEDGSYVPFDNPMLAPPELRD